MGNTCDDSTKTCLTQCLPKNHIAGSLLLIISTYSTLLAIVEQTSTKEALRDADNKTIFDINEEYTNVTISKISSPILWNCRNYSMTRHNYRNIYVTLIVVTLLWIIIGMFKIPFTGMGIFHWCKTKTESRCCGCLKESSSSLETKDCILTCLQLLSNIILRLSLIFMITSFDIDTWACIHGPSSIKYVKNTQVVELTLPKSIIYYHVVGLSVAFVLGIIGWIIGVFVSEKDEE